MLANRLAQFQQVFDGVLLPDIQVNTFSQYRAPIRHSHCKARKSRLSAAIIAPAGREGSLDLAEVTPEDIVLKCSRMIQTQSTEDAEELITPQHHPCVLEWLREQSRRSRTVER